MRRRDIALHGQQHHIHRYAGVDAAYRLIEESGALGDPDIAAQRRRCRTLGRQPVRDQDDLVGRLHERARRTQCVDEARAALRQSGIDGDGDLSSPLGIACGQPLACGPAQQRFSGFIEAIDLELSTGRQLRHHPTCDVGRSLPFGRRAASRLIGIPQADDLHQIIVHHACRSVEQHQHALAAQRQTGDVTPAGRGTRCTGTLSLGRIGLRTGFESSGALVQRAHIGFQTLDALAFGERAGIVDRALLATLLELLDQSGGPGGRRDRLTVGTAQRVAQQHQVFGACHHLFLEQRHLRGEILGLAGAFDAALGADDGVEQDDGAEAATDHVEERQAEDLDATALQRRSPGLLSAGPRRRRSRRVRRRGHRRGCDHRQRGTHDRRPAAR